MDRMRFNEEIADRLGGTIGGMLRRAVPRCPTLPSVLTEIRIRAGQPLCLHFIKGEGFLSQNGSITPRQNAYCVLPSDINDTVQRVCQHSRYAYAQDIRNGYITVPGGHRIGLAGKMIHDGSLTEISSMTVRVAREIKDASQDVFPHILRGNQDVYSTLIISPPGCGKTTLLRDLARKISGGDKKTHFTGLNVGVVDERSEIAACFRGIPSNDLGIRTDVYDGCPKEKGILMMLRSMAPNVIVTDELGGGQDMEAVLSAMNAGVRILATAHGYGIQENCLRPEIKRLLSASLFERYVVLSCKNGAGTLEGVYGFYKEKIYERSEG